MLSEGDLTSTLRLYPKLEGNDTETSVTSVAMTRWGPAEILVHQVGKPDVRIPGVCFNLYASKEDAEAQRNKISIDGVSEWVTDKNGEVAIHGLRFSDFVNGKTVAKDDPLYRTYCVVMSCIPDGWHGTAGPLPLDVLSVTKPEIAVVELYPVEEPEPGPKPTPGPGDGALSQTGAEVLVATALGITALVLGILLLRRKKPEEEDA